MYNLYRGNSGRAIRMEEKPRDEPRRELPKPRNEPDALLSLLGKSIGELESEDLILILILYLMYRESGDKELLMIMGAMFLP